MRKVTATGSALRKIDKAKIHRKLERCMQSGVDELWKHIKDPEVPRKEKLKCLEPYLYKLMPDVSIVKAQVEHLSPESKTELTDLYKSLLKRKEQQFNSILEAKPVEKK